jgi:dTDP-glucose 4,6-dehydratase
VTDTVEGFIAAATTAGLPPGIELQLGSGVETSIRDVLIKVGDLLGKRLCVETEDKRIRPAASEVDRLLCDPSETTRLLGWKARVPFEDGLRRVIECAISLAPDHAHAYML